MRKKTLAVLFGGIGGFSLGATRARVEYGGDIFQYDLLVSIDSDPVACANHDLIVGEHKSKVMDLFSRQQYIDFHGHEPPDDWVEVTPWDIWVAFKYQVPDVVFLSPPCKGLSGLLPEASAKSNKYQALNKLTVRGIELVLLACYLYGGKVPKIIHFENVPRITSRGKYLLAEIQKLLKEYNYAIDMNPSHNLGEIGGLGQSRIRFLIMARQQSEVPNFIYLPPKKSLRTIGAIISPLPPPGDIIAGGWMHRIPKLMRKTWERLALIVAGGDWRNLNALDWENYRITYEPRGAGAYGVQDWEQPANTITGQAKITGSNGCAAVADPRIGHFPREGVYEVADWDKPSRTVIGSSSVGTSNGVQAIQDPRTGYGNDTHASVYRICRFDQVGPTVTGATGPNNGCVSVADPRLNVRDSRHPGVYRVIKIDEPSPCVTGTRFGSGALAIADPRLNCECRNGSYGVHNWNESARTITSADIHAGTAAVADHRIPEDTEKGVYLIIALDGAWHRPLTTFELAMLQSFSRFLPDGRPFQLENCSDAKAREYIGNAYPPDAAEASCVSILLALAKADAKIEFELSNDFIWVTPIEKREGEGEIEYENGSYY